MGMLIRRHRQGVDEVRTELHEDHPHGIETPPLVEGDTGTPPVPEGATSVPTGSVPSPSVASEEPAPKRGSSKAKPVSGPVE